MIDWIRGCLARVGCLTLLVGGVAAGWAYQDDIAEWWEARAPAAEGAEPSERLAERAETRLARMLESGRAGEIRLSGAEVQSLVRYRVEPRLPPGVDRPEVAMRDSSAEVTASLDLVRLVGTELPAMVRRMVGDSARLTAGVRPGVDASGRLRLQVEDLSAGAVQVPSVMLPWLLAEFGLPTAADDPRSVVLDVGYGLTSARVEAGELVLAREAGPG